MRMPAALKKFQNKFSQINRIPGLDRFEPSSDVAATEAELAKYQKVQRLAYQCAQHIAKEMQEGWTEKQTALLMDTYLKDHGVNCFFHRSFAWFGDRTRFQNFSQYWHFLPTNRRLKPDDMVILDTAPILNGFAGDIGYTCALDMNMPRLKQARETLMIFRRELPALFASDLDPAQICERVDLQIKGMGHDNCHAMYPFEVLGHRLPQTSFGKLPGLVIPFSWQTYWGLFSRGFYNQLFGPHHVGNKIGIWAIEPHLGGDGYGFKFEEILVVTDQGAYWLDDKVPHNLD